MLDLRLIPIGRLYETEQQAKDVVARLVKLGYNETTMSVVTPGSVSSADSLEEIAEVIDATHDASEVPSNQALTYAEHVQAGKALVLCTAEFGFASRVTNVMNSGSPVDIGALPLPPSRSIRATPLSDFLGIPVLKQGMTFASSGNIRSKHYLPSFLGLGLLSKNSTPLSSAIGLSTLSGSKGPGDRSFGLPLLMDDATPLSSRVGVKTLSEDSRPRDTSFGMPLVIDNPTPLSSWLGLPVLSRKN